MSNDKSTSGGAGQGNANQTRVNPGDDAAPGTPGTGENVCHDCKGSGRLNNAPCKTCGGTGKVIEGISGA
jgi:DnaJ-class molecular chaperone